MAIGCEAITATYGTPFEYANEAAILCTRKTGRINGIQSY
jgi:hypothetical protein